MQACVGGASRTSPDTQDTTKNYKTQNALQEARQRRSPRRDVNGSGQCVRRHGDSADVWTERRRVGLSSAEAGLGGVAGKEALKGRVLTQRKHPDSNPGKQEVPASASTRGRRAGVLRRGASAVKPPGGTGVS